ncbi:CAP domain-containing protein [Salininema proteolyticum]|uniref:CAP domain-containing protein n=1 Tax=Salininema proteolyticum TaxID=1607685 RepID=A0ABV8TZ55_9ACTN
MTHQILPGRHRSPEPMRYGFGLSAALAVSIAAVVGITLATGADGGENHDSPQAENAPSPSIESSAEPDPGPTGSPEPDAAETEAVEDPATEDPEPDDSPEDTGPPPEESEAPEPTNSEAVIELVNDRRAENGCGPLEVSPELTAAAEGHAEDMGVNDYFDHDSLDGRSVGDRAAEAGFHAGVGENIAKGQRSPEEVMEAWMDSPGHRANILKCDWNFIGTGYYLTGDGIPYWVQNFGW